MRCLNRHIRIVLQSQTFLAVHIVNLVSLPADYETQLTYARSKGSKDAEAIFRQAQAQLSNRSTPVSMPDLTA